ncbi:DUF86 domain-containing protein [Candidatus Woesearchaeota archaeon]|nr:DUF86 domain-containing protein [Candidatus Woesearchaeota archaeon]
MKREYGDYIQDISDSIKETEEFTKELSFADFKEDKKTVNAVIRSLEIMGEAAKKIPDELRRKHLKIPWKEMAGIRDKLIHEYHGVDLEIIWKVVKEELPPIKPNILNLLKELEHNGGNTK